MLSLCYTQFIASPIRFGGIAPERLNGGSGALLKARNSFVNDPAGYSGRTPLGECGGPLIPDVRIAQRGRRFG